MQQRPINNDQKKKLEKIKTQVAQLEDKLTRLKKNKTDLENSLAAPEIYNDKNKFLHAEANYNKAVKDLSDANAEYETLFEKMMELEENG